MRRFAAAILAMLLLAALPARAQEEPPARVGRISFVSGQIAFHLPDETQWSQAAVNYPVAAGGSFWTDPKSRAEMRIGAQTISLDGNTEVDVVMLNAQVMQLGLPQGRIELHVRDLGQGESVEVDLPRGGVWLLQPGVYDISAGTADQPSRIETFSGRARFVGGSVDIALSSSDAAIISGTDTLSASLEHAAPDAFSEWCRSRDYQPPRVAGARYVSPHMTGYEELDEYGAWSSAPDYGQVWYPRSVPADWAPYREGHWVSIEPWGWTWVDNEPWGFAPFHYGRWARIHGRWGWVPGRFEERPVYAPALVAFIGAPDAGIAIAGAPGPAVGWFPLAPGEVYWPTYTRNPTYIRNVNITNVSETKITNIIQETKVTNVTNVTVNQAAPTPPAQVVQQNFANRTAATVVPVRAFASAKPVAQVAVAVKPQALQAAPVSVRPPVQPVAAARPVPVHPAAPPPAIKPTTATARPPAVSPQAPATPQTAPAVAHPPAAATQPAPTAPTVAHPPAAAPHPAPTAPTVAHPPAIAPHPAPTAPTVAHPPAAAPHPTPTAPTVAHPPAIAPHPAPTAPTVAHPPAAAPHPAPTAPTVAHPPAASPHPAPAAPTVAHPPAAPPHPAPAAPTVAPPPAAPPHPAPTVAHPAPAHPPGKEKKPEEQK